MLEDLRPFLGFDSADSNAASLASWVHEVLAEELHREGERMQVFDQIQRPAEMPLVSLERFMPSHRPAARTETHPLGPVESSLSRDFGGARTTLMPSLFGGFRSPRSQTDVSDRWEDSTRSPLPKRALPVTPLPRPDRVPPHPGLAPAAHPATPSTRRSVVWVLAGLTFAVALASAGVWAERTFPATGAIVVTTHASVGLSVEVDNQPVVLSKEGVGVIRDLRPGAHFLLAKGPVERQVRWVTVVANEVASVNLVFSKSPDPPDPVLAHNRE